MHRLRKELEKTVIAHFPVAVSGYTVGSADSTARNKLQDETCSGVGGRSKYEHINDLIRVVFLDCCCHCGQRMYLTRKTVNGVTSWLIKNRGCTPETSEVHPRVKL